jgi:decaprenylphospho-beta-D-erythro-pentofuranosid-2-ulose 2-reductase
MQPVLGLLARSVCFPRLCKFILSGWRAGSDCYNTRMTTNVVVFGATSAIAREVARLYAQRGARLFLVGRTPDKLARVAASLGSSVIGTRVQDFDRTEEAESCVAEAVRALGRLDVTLIAHGDLGDQLASEQSHALAEQITRTNYLSVVALIIPLARVLEQQRAGRLLVLSTVAAERGRPRNYTYAAAKSALNVYLQGTRSRLYASGVAVHTIKLGPVDTPMTTMHRKNPLFSTPAKVARSIVAAVDRGDAEVFVPSFWRPIMFAVRNLPESLFQRVGALAGR